MILVIDNYDSFTYNLVHLVEGLGQKVIVFRNDAITLSQIQALRPSHILLSPGPGGPERAGISTQVVQAFPQVPLLGVCLGHQCLAAAFGAVVTRARRAVHGKTSAIYHRGTGLFRGLPNPFQATRYHSLIVSSLPSCLEVTAWTAEGEVMAIRHRHRPAFGVQFHPESVLTPEGKRLMENFLEGDYD